MQRENASAAHALASRDPALLHDSTLDSAARGEPPEATFARGAGRSLLALLGFGAVSVLGGAVSGLVHRSPRTRTWYRLLAKPSFTPPDRTFPIVWPVLYAGAAVSGWRVWMTPKSPERTRALALWGAQMGFNGAWSPIFFGAHRPTLALANLTANAASLAAYARAAAKVDRAASLLVTPYLAWLGFAALMNGGIIAKNRGPLRRHLMNG